MNRYNEVKVLLKSWEADFLKQHKRKPNQVDVEDAPEDTQKLYKEYRSLKQEREREPSSTDQSSLSSVDHLVVTPDIEGASKTSSSWGLHLNRASTTSKLTEKERDSMKASAQYFGMKLKTNLEGNLKTRPFSFRKSLTPRLKSQTGSLEGEVKKNSTPLTLSSKPAVDQPPDPMPVFDEELHSLPWGVIPPSLNTSFTSHEQPGKFQHLKTQVGQRLTSLNQNWLERCEVQQERRNDGTKCEITGRLNMTMKVKQSDRPVDEKPGEFLGSLAGLDIGGNGIDSSSSVPSNQGPLPLGQSPTPFIAGLSPPRLPCTLRPNESVKNLEESHGGSDKPVTNIGVRSNTCGLNPYDRGIENLVKPNQRGTDEGVDLNDSSYKTGEKAHSECSEKTQDVISEDGPYKLKQEMDHLSSEKCGGHKPELTKVKSDSKRNKRQREAPNNLEISPGGLKKRRKVSTKTSTTPTSRGAATKKKGHQIKEPVETLAESPPSKQIVSECYENLLGEVEEEGKTTIGHTERRVKQPQRKTDNFVRINLKNKSHVKGYALNGSRLRKQMWKQKFQKKGQQFGGGAKHFNRSEDTCFRCGSTGHWASECTGRVSAPLLPVSDPEDEEEVNLPTLEDVARMTNTQLGDSISPVDDPAVPQEKLLPLHVIRAVYEAPAPPPAVKPLYELGPGGEVQKAPPEVYEALSELGYKSFRPGQEEAVMRILSGLSSLVILSTGMGKSLCYQLPAYLYAKRSKCITLVISPLVSLMDDQVSGLPPKLKAVCIHSNMTKIQREAAIEKVKEGSVHVLLLSPEALVGGGQSGSSCLPPADQLPPVAFACIDEAHCVSEWSHNFRPCYLRLCKVLRERLGVWCLLGLTATATIATAEDVAHHLGVSDEGGVPMRLAGVPPNLHLSSSMDRDKDQALVTLLKGERFGCLDSIIVYCTRREETERIAALLRTCLQGVIVSKRQTEDPEGEEDTASNRKKAQARKKMRRPLKWVADSYHAGMSAAQRRRVQNNFMSGQLRLVVATVAFGMGLDKSDVRGVIHYNMPKNFESYVQEIGRSGRDGKDAQCHLFLDPEAQDLHELRRHVFADTVDYFTVKKLVQSVFPRCKCRDIHKKQEALSRGGEVDDGEMMELLDQCDQEERGGCDALSPKSVAVERVCYRHERAIPIEETVQRLDIREEGIETLLCYLELHPQRWLELLHPTLSSCRIVCYSGPQQLRKLATSCPPVAVTLARERLAGVDHTHVSSLEFNVVELSDSMGWEVIPVKRALRDLQWMRHAAKGFQGTGKSGVLVEFSKLSFHFRSYGDLTDQEMETVCDFLHHKVTSRESTALRHLRSCYKAFQRVAYSTSSSCSEKVSAERSAQLKALLLQYFERREPLEEDSGEDPLELSRIKAQDWRDQVLSDVRHFLSIHQDERFSGRAIARIFHGIGNPCYPAQIYGRDRRFWRKYIHLDFNEVMCISKEEIIRLK
ncbi:ATP-dependent DNA helicase Q4 isoform 2-T2 [Discoglossus pictus]